MHLKIYGNHFCTRTDESLHAEKLFKWIKWSTAPNSFMCIYYCKQHRVLGTCSDSSPIISIKCRMTCIQVEGFHNYISSPALSLSGFPAKILHCCIHTSQSRDMTCHLRWVPDWAHIRTVGVSSVPQSPGIHLACRKLPLAENLWESCISLASGCIRNYHIYVI